MKQLFFYFLKYQKMITCYLKYIIDPYKTEEFEHYGRMWIPLVNKLGGIHHGYFMPHEGTNNIAYALFSFPSLATYEVYRERIKTDADCQKAIAYANETRCIVSYDRSFMKPIFE
jgi:hypothetical protein